MKVAGTMVWTTQCNGDAHHHSGIPILGAAPSGRAADELAHSTGLHATTMHSLLHHHLRRHALPTGCVLVIDEAGMADTRTLSPIIRAVDEANGKLILVGDPAETIAKVAREQACDLIVMGTRGLGTVTGVLLGSVATKVIHLSDRPVLLVK